MKDRTKKELRHIGMMLFVAYVLLLVYFLFFSEGYGRIPGEGDYRYNLTPLVEIRRFWTYRRELGMTAVAENILGNVIGFMPFGFILPIISRKRNSPFGVIMLGFLLSLCVECIQLISRVGCFDVDDLILNTLGAAVGYLIFAVCNYLRRKHYGKKI